MTRDDLEIKHRKLHPISLVFGLLLFVFLYINKQSVLASSKQACLIFIILFLAFNGYFLLLSLWVDSVFVNRLDKTLIVERKIGPFKRTHFVDSEKYKFISIHYYSTGARHYYEIGLKRNEQAKPVRLIGTYFLGDTWSKAVKIARCLNLPIYDTLWWNTVVWKNSTMPANNTERKKILKQKVGTDRYFQQY